jgi:hypothetical protein
LRQCLSVVDLFLYIWEQGRGYVYNLEESDNNIVQGLFLMERGENKVKMSKKETEELAKKIIENGKKYGIPSRDKKKKKEA